MSKLFWSISVGFNSAFYDVLYFVKGPIKIQHDRIGFDWLISKFFPILYFCEAILVIVQVSRSRFFLTDSVIINIIYIIHTVVGIRSKHYKWNVIKLTAQKLKFSIKDFFSKYYQIRRHLLKKSLMENFFFCAETVCSVYSKGKKRKRVTNFSNFLFEMKEENKNI